VPLSDLLSLEMKIQNYFIQWLLTRGGKITHLRRKNYICQLYLQDGSCVVQHGDKAEVLWTSFKERLGVSSFHKIHYDLQDLIPVIDILELDYPFFEEEMQMALQDTPNDHALGPDGFNMLFMKKCWNIINEEYKRFVSQFYNCSTDLSHLNGSFISLIRKIESLRTPSDVRLISLLNSSMELMTKMLSTRL
jgi:hypothetical protein